MRQITGVYRQKIKDWYKEFVDKLCSNGHPVSELPNINRFKFYISNEGVKIICVQQKQALR